MTYVAPSVVDPRLTTAPVVLDFADAVEGLIVGLYVGGSLASGDYRPGISDLDAVALVGRPPSPTTRGLIVNAHERLVREADGGRALHCVYVPRTDIADPTRKHWTWAFDELFRRPFSGIARAELLANPIVVMGPPPSSWLPRMDTEALREAARAELAGYWSRALRKRKIWLSDIYVDMGLTVLARADATIREGRLITKTEAIARMPDLGVPLDIVDGIDRRRHSQPVVLADEERQDRAIRARRILTDGIAHLLSLRPGAESEEAGSS